MNRITAAFALSTAILVAGGIPAAAVDIELTATPIVDGLNLPLYAVAPPGDPRLFVLEQTGTIRILENGGVAPEPFLDVTSEVSTGGEQGLLGLAFHPDYAENGRFFVDYTDRSGTTQIVEYAESGADPNRADPDSAKPLLSIAQPYGNHNGGWLGFGPDGLLYVATGDGGSGGDPQGNGQNPDTLLGKLLRLDIDGGTPYAIPADNPFAEDGAGRPEIFALGVRNSWRPAFDGDQLYVADVGQNAEEEISVISTADAGANLGWNVMEGAACFNAQTCDSDGFVMPVHSYSHADGGCSITGGYVYRGAAIPALAGQYFYADYCGGFVRSFALEDGEIGDITDWSDSLNVGAITSFGQDAAGELYLTTIEGGLYQIEPAR